MLKTNDGGTGGDYSFGLGPTGFAGSINYGSTNNGGTLTINGTAYTLLYSMSDVQGINSSNATLSGNYALATSLDASSVTNWIPIGTDGAGALDFFNHPQGVLNSSNGFSGVFAGLGNTISNFTINLPTITYVGLFGYSSGTIRDIGLIGGSVSAYRFSGTLVGVNTASGTIANSYATSTMNGGTTSLVAEFDGGLVGQNNGTISDSYATGAVNGFDTDGGGELGGLAGDDNGTITDSYATGAVGGAGGAGGLVGFLGISAVIANSHATGTVSGNLGAGGAR